MSAEVTTELIRSDIDGAVLHGDADVVVTGVAYDSRRVVAGDLFCCVPGELVDGHVFAAAAVEAGARALVVEHDVPVAVPQIVVPDARTAMARAAVRVFDDPSRDLRVVGVTGTNGKTTVTYLLANILAEGGVPAAVLGTLSGARSTPEAPDLQRWLHERTVEGVDVVAMEVSSHALELHRVDGTTFVGAVFTNLSRDHLDFHGTMEAYFEAKAKLFSREFTSRAVVNGDDPYGRLLRDAASPLDLVVNYSLDDVEDLRIGRAGSTFTWQGQQIELALGGRFNVSNAIAAATAASSLLGMDETTIARGLTRPLVIPGRFEVVDAGQPFTLIVDYAHTPDGLDRLLEAADELAASGQVSVVFGCGGDRDASKRAPMGEVAARRADTVIVTADNSRSEDSAAIIDAVLLGTRKPLHPRATHVVAEPDRRAAIERALATAAPDDVVVIAGKGHETTQTLGDDVLPFDDREVARELLRAAGFDSSGHAEDDAP
jgi:UDP-N-acetylmuramoyl-L-alanyl-D-glutamate--2,6-diaminopimelate ligase